MKSKFCLSIFALLFSIVAVNAQNPLVSSVEPAAQVITASVNSNILVHFDIPIDENSIDENSFKVFGRWSGPMSGTVALENSGATLRFIPDEGFFYGEWVTINVSKCIQSDDGGNLQKAYAWGFWTETLDGFLLQQEINVIEVQQEGEGAVIAYGAYAGDINNDGFSDLSVVNEATDDIRLFLNDGTGNYSEFEIFPLPEGDVPSPNEGADFNSDGNIDMAIANTINNKVSVLMGDGIDGYEEEEAYTVGQAVRGIGILDANGDGYDDIVTANRTGNNFSILINDGTGSFEDAYHIDTEGNQETSIAVADINGDGIMDVFLGAYLSEELMVLLGDGDGGFEMSDIISINGRPWMLAAGDVNGDGNVDVVSANSTTDKAMVCLGDGMGNLGVPQYYNSFSFPLAIDLGDIDGDGDLDMMSSNYSGGTYYLFENNGNGEFEAPIIFDASIAGSCVILHDRDNDGDMDITGIDEIADLIFLFENPGNPIGVEQVHVVDDFSLSQNWPNPTNGSTTIQYKVKDSEIARLLLKDVNGKTVQEYTLDSGSDYLELNLSKFNSGVYYYEMLVADKLVGRYKLLLLK